MYKIVIVIVVSMSVLTGCGESKTVCNEAFEFISTGISKACEENDEYRSCRICLCWESRGFICYDEFRDLCVDCEFYNCSISEDKEAAEACVRNPDFCQLAGGMYVGFGCISN